MSIITISSDSYDVGREIAEKAAKVLNYKCFGREVLAKIAEKHGVPELKLAKALDQATSFPGMSTKLRDRYLTYIKAYVSTLLLEDNTVCHGLAAHLYLTEVSHVFKVGILSNSKKLVNQDSPLVETDASHYDLVINLGQIDKKKAVNIITETVIDRKFKPITYSLNCIEDIEMETRVKAVLLEPFPGIKVCAKRGIVVVETKGFKFKKEKKCSLIKKMAGKLPGVINMEVHINSYISRN